MKSRRTIGCLDGLANRRSVAGTAPTDAQFTKTLDAVPIIAAGLMALAAASRMVARLSGDDVSKLMSSIKALRIQEQSKRPPNPYLSASVI
jgi:hypothetical protein